MTRFCISFLFMAAPVVAASAQAGAESRVLAFLEDRCAQTLKGLAHETVVRYAFVKKDGRWAPAGQDAPKVYQWLPVGQGQPTHRIETRDSEIYKRRIDVGVQETITISTGHFSGDATYEFSGWASCKVYKPVVLSLTNSGKGKEGWKKDAPKLPLTEKMFQLIKANVRDLYRETETGTELFEYKPGDMYAAETYLAGDKSRLAAFRFKPDSGAEDIAGSSSQALYWLYVPASGAPAFVGRDLALIAHGDYDFDGKTEFLFWLSGYNLDGYRIFWNGFRESETLSWKYH